jgi:tryptophan synthase alpha chain
MINLKEYLLNIKQNQNRLGFMPFWLAGYPTINESINKMKILLEYCDVLEIGIPFSDPSADGPIIENAAKIAIENGFNTSDLFYCITKANEKFKKPIVILCYFNTVLQYGIEKFCQNANTAGINAVLIPDLPPEESELVKQHFDKYNIELVYIISTNTSIERIKYIDNISNSFIYFISKPSITGITNNEIPQETLDLIDKIRNLITNPLYIGFGISNKEQIKQYFKTKADGFIVGSKLISFDKNEELSMFLNSIKNI